MKGKIYDGFYPELKKKGIAATNNIGNPIDVNTFKVVDDESEYFQDKNGLYYYSAYPTSGCLPSSPEGGYSEPIILHKIILRSGEEVQLYRGQNYNIFVTRYGRRSYTPYAQLNGSLYWRDPNGQFTKIPGADPARFRMLSENMMPSDLYTDDKYVFLNGKIVDIDPEKFQEISYMRKGSGERLVSNFFKANAKVYYLTDPLLQETDTSFLLTTDADASTFEVIDTSGSYSGLKFRDRNYFYHFNKDTKAIEKFPASPS